MQAQSPQHSAVLSAQHSELEWRKEQAAAELLQQRMLPKSPLQLGHFKIDYEIFPALPLSGDFVDVTRLSDQRFAFIVADVAGHGTSGALLTVWLKSFMCRLVDARLHQPADILQQMNAELIALGMDRHTCVVCGVVDEPGDRLTLACAGAYPQPMLTRAAGRPHSAHEKMHTAGKALGLFPDIEFPQQAFELQAGDRLTVVTDGLFELLGANDLASKEAQLVAAAEASGASEFWSALNVVPAAGGCDDVTRFQLERLPSGIAHE